MNTTPKLYRLDAFVNEIILFQTNLIWRPGQEGFFWADSKVFSSVTYWIERRSDDLWVLKRGQHYKTARLLTPSPLEFPEVAASIAILYEYNLMLRFNSDCDKKKKKKK